MGSIAEFIENKTILITGASGFLGKKRILREQPNIKKIYLLIRSSDSNSALLRLHSEIIGKDIFRAIKERYGTNFQAFIWEKVQPVTGDISYENLGVMDVDLFNEMRTQVDVVVNSAATTKLDERYDVAMGTNTLGAQHISDFVNQCYNVKLLLHVSTAYVRAEKPGIIPESPFMMGETLNNKHNLDIEREINIIHERHEQLAIEKANEETISYSMEVLGTQRAKLHGWPNAYVFTKSMGEMVLFDGLRHDVSLVVLRPTIITSTYKEPFPGWIEGVKTIDSFIAAYARGMTPCFLGDPATVLDLIPADMVVNALMVTMAAHINQPYSKIIYHVGSSMTNPMTLSTLTNCMCNYFANNPLISKHGKPIETSKKILLFSSISGFNRYVAVHYRIPLERLEHANGVHSGAASASYLDMERKMKITLRLVKLYKPYVVMNSIFDDANLNKLRNVKAEVESFFVDLKTLDWEDYFMKIHFPGLVKYALGGLLRGSEKGKWVSKY